MPALATDRTLLNAKFEGYRLDPVVQEDIVARHDLPTAHRPTQATLSGRTLPSLQEVQSRIQHNHLAVSSSTSASARAVYVAADGAVVAVDLDNETLAPHIRTVYELPRTVSGAAAEAAVFQREYPCASFLAGALWLVADGQGFVYTLEIPEAGDARLLAASHLAAPAPETAPALPFKLHACAQVTASEGVAILSSVRHEDTSPDGQSSARGKRGRSSVEFDVWLVKIALASAESTDSVPPLAVLWRGRATEPPTYVTFSEAHQAFLVVCNSPCEPIDHPAAAYEPSADELAPIPRAGEDLNGNGTGGPPPPPPPPPPYSWTQTADTVTVAFPLPATTSKDDITVTFAPHTLTVLVAGAALPQYAQRPLWAGIQPSTSYWTWEREAAHALGLLTVYLDKQHEGTRWPHLFDAGAANSDADDAEAEVPETLDASALAHIRDALEKHTAALRDGADPSGLGLGQGVPSLGQGEMDEVDDSMGRPAFLTWVSADGTLGPRDDSPVQLLASPLPGWDVPPVSLVTKNGIDGLLFSLDRAGPGAPPAWAHTATFSALSFVLASKRDTRFTFHVAEKAVLAFESGSGHYGGNVYVYRGSKKEIWGKQAVLKVGAGTGGTLLGVGMLPRHNVILCLCEGELVILRNLV